MKGKAKIEQIGAGAYEHHEGASNYHTLVGKWKTLKWKPKYRNGSTETEVRRKAAYRCLVHECAL